MKAILLTIQTGLKFLWCNLTTADSIRTSLFSTVIKAFCNWRGSISLSWSPDKSSSLKAVDRLWRLCSTGSDWNSLDQHFPGTLISPAHYVSSSLVAGNIVCASPSSPSFRICVRAWFLPKTKLSCVLPHQLREVTKFPHKAVMLEVILANFVIPTVTIK